MKSHKITGWLLLQDIVGYTSFSERLREKGKQGIEKLTAILNDFFEEQESRISKEGGFIFKLAGDAFFGAIPPVPFEEMKEIADLLINSETLEKYGLASRIVALKGGFELHEIPLSGASDIIPFGPIVNKLVKLEDSTERGVVIREYDNNFAGEFVIPSFWKKHSYKDVLITFRPQVVSFVRLDVEDVRSMYAVASFIVKNLPYAYLSKIMPYKKGVMLVIFYGFPKSTGKEKDIALITSVELKRFLEDRSIDYGIGLSYDFVYTGVVGGNIFKEFTFIGDGINIAARLADKAKHDILITESIKKTLEGRYDFEFKENVVLKGKKEKVAIYSPLREKKRAYVKKLVDRKREKNIIEDAFYRKVNLLIIGDAGTGKSRVLLDSIEGKREAYVYVKGLPDQPALHTIRDILFKFSDSDIKKYPLLYAIKNRENINVSDNYPVMIGLFLRRLFSERGIFRLVVDDIHWVDEVSASVLLDIASNSEFSIIATLRNEYRMRYDLSGFKKLFIDSLPEEYAHEFSEVYLNERVSDEFAMEIYGRSYGIPFLMEQFINYVKDRKLLIHVNGKANLKKETLNQIPMDAFSLILARYDLLPDNEKRFITVASCMGNEFKLKDVLDIMPVKLRHVYPHNSITTGFIRPLDNERYTFVHSLLRETVYAGILGTKRSNIHRRIARLFVDRGYNSYEIALHYERGGAYLKAEKYWIKTFQNLLNIGFDKESEKIIPHIRTDFEKRLATAYLYHHRGEYRNAEKILRYLITNHRGKKRMRALLLLASVYDFWGKYDMMLKILNSLKRYESIMDEEQRYSYIENWGIYYDMTGRKKEALSIYKKTIMYARTPYELSTSFYNIGWIYHFMHKYKIAERYFKKAIKVNPDDRMNVAWCLLRLGQIELIRLNFEKAGELLEESLSKFMESGYRFGTMLVVGSLIGYYVWAEDCSSLELLYERISPMGINDSYLIKFYFAFEYFEDRKYEDDVWKKMTENLKTKTRVIKKLVEGRIDEVIRMCKDMKDVEECKWVNFIEGQKNIQNERALLIKKLLGKKLSEKERKIFKRIRKYGFYEGMHAILLRKIGMELKTKKHKDK